MGAELSPAFLFYPEPFLTDERSARMPDEVCGNFIRLLCHAWIEVSLPSEPAQLADLLKVPRQRFEARWEQHLRDCFVDVRGRLVNPRLERERQRQHVEQRAQADLHQRRRAAAVQAAAARWGRKW